MGFIDALPAVNAGLNSLAFVLLVLGYRRIQRKDVDGHRRFMLAAFATSTVFLASYLTRHALGDEQKFPEEYPTARTIYLFVLLSHILLAAICLPMVLTTLYFAAKGKLEKHRRLARWTFPIWVYVSVTGVLIYFALYQWYAD